MSRNTKIITIVVLSLLCAVQAFYLKVVATGSHSADDAPAAFFNTASKSANVGRTLKPDGQTEEAGLCTDLTFYRELGDLCPELWTPSFTVDRQYISPTEQTARLILRRAFRKLENVYVADAYDCDDNATELAVLMRKEALVEYREYPAALALGWVGVQIDAPIDGLKGLPEDPTEYPLYHAMLIFRIKGGHWLLIEPLTHQTCELTGPIFEGAIIVRVIYF